MANFKKIGRGLKLLFGPAVLYLGTGRALAHEGSVPHSHQDWQPLIIVAVCLAALSGVLGFWRYRRRLDQRRHPEAFVPPPISLPSDDEAGN